MDAITRITSNFDIECSDIISKTKYGFKFDVDNSKVADIFLDLLGSTASNGVTDIHMHLGSETKVISILKSDEPEKVRATVLQFLKQLMSRVPSFTSSATASSDELVAIFKGCRATVARYASVLNLNVEEKDSRDAYSIIFTHNGKSAGQLQVSKRPDNNKSYTLFGCIGNYRTDSGIPVNASTDDKKKAVKQFINEFKREVVIPNTNN